jgi:hypothetical protein
MTILRAADLRISGPGTQPQLVFACEQDDARLQKLFADRSVVANLRDLNASVSLALVTLSADRAQVVRELNSAGIPVFAWIALPNSQGYYLNAANEPQVAERFAQFESWNAQYRLHWAGIGLDIEPNIQEFHESIWKLAPLLARRSVDTARVTRARRAYAGLIAHMQARGYSVQTYQFPFIADERRMHSTALERLVGLVDVRGDQEALMLYTSFSHGAGPALIWKYAPDAQLIVVGVVSNDAPVPGFFVPLDWQELSRDLIVAGHFSRIVGVYALEGCVQKGFLSRIKSIDWSSPVNLPQDSIARATRVRFVVQTVLWILSRLPLVVGVAVVGIALLLRWHRRRKIAHPLLPRMTTSAPVGQPWANPRP